MQLLETSKTLDSILTVLFTITYNFEEYHQISQANGCNFKRIGHYKIKKTISNIETNSKRWV